ncbi:methyltransferase [Variovorax sp. J22R133]|uniref:methyltransferase n=1 Tax=Variovorax brevis TaxID=3053503 RepID=UPI0025770767|nr:methyltransferase [Variovorax sp. J22R133]MDM0113791.1 methyltransferase [Variovorax sp. J22R133]
MQAMSATPSGARSMRDRWLAWRDRLLASRSFQRAAAAFPLTAPIARKRASELFNLVAGFVYSQVLLACVQLRLFDTLAEGPQTIGELSARLCLPVASTERLIAAAEALKLVEARGGGRFGLGTLGAPMVGNTAITAMIEHHASLYADLRDPVALLRGEETSSSSLARYWPYADAPAPGALTAASVQAYSALMTASQPLVADEILDAYPLSRHRCLLDVGGGEGAFVLRAATRAPRLRLVLFDLPAVADRARARCAASDVGGRVQIVGGSFLSDALPKGADVASLVRVIHDHDDAAALRILRAVREALTPGGTLLLAEPMAGTPGAQAMGNAYFGFYLLAMGRGRPRTAKALRSLLHAAGFECVRPVPTRMPLQTSLLVARTPIASAPGSGV